MSKSAKIRELYDATDLTVAEIADKVGVRYQFAYNVVARHCAKKGEKVRKARPITTSSQIREMLDRGMSPGQIAKMLNTNYVFVHQVAKRYYMEKSGSLEEDVNEEEVEVMDDVEEEVGAATEDESNEG